MALTITEAWVRERVQLAHDNLEDVRSLSLPGTYQEKISNLGNALSSFTRLKQLDLSRNGLQSLHGLHHLGLLEKLNLYYNNIGSLDELKRLRHNTSLQELDLRLNPVTKNEPDYRLFLVHMLPSLRKLDDRSIRESERKSALLHFDSDQATSLTEHGTSPARDGGRSELPRPKHVRSLGQRSAIEDDDSDLLDLLARTDGDLTKPRPVTGSGVGNPSVEIDTMQDYQRPYSQRTPPCRRPVSSGPTQLQERSLYQPELTLDSVLGANTSIGSNSTGSLLDADPLNDLDDMNLSGALSPIKSPLSLHPIDDISTMHDTPPSPTDTNTLVDDITNTSSAHIWQPSEPFLEDRQTFDLDHKELLSPTDTNSLIDESMANFGKARLSFSPVEERRKLDFGSYVDDKLDGGLLWGDDGVVSIARTSPQPLSRSPLLLEERRALYPMSDSEDDDEEDLGDVSRVSLTPRERGPIKAGDIYSSIMSQARSRARQEGQAGQSTPNRRSPGTSILSDSHAKRPGPGLAVSPLAKESKKSVRFMLGDSTEDGDSDVDISTPKRNQCRGPQTPYNANLSQRLSNSIDINQNILKIGDGSRPSVNRNNSNSNSLSMIDTSALISTPQENKYSNMIVGRGRGSYSATIERKSPINDASNLNLSSSLMVSPKHKSKFPSPAKTYSFAMHGEGSSTESSPVSVPLHVSTHSPLTSNLPIHPHPNLNPLVSSLSVSTTNPTDPSSTASPPSTNQSQGSTMDSSLSSLDTGHRLGSESDSSLHHVHHLLTPAPEPPQHSPDPERSQGRHQTEEGRRRVDGNLKFTDETDAYTAFSSKVNFTPNPKSGDRVDPSSYNTHSRLQEDTYQEPPPVQRVTKQKTAPGMDQTSFLDSILNLVDRYWNGSKSLHSHSKFKAQAQSLLGKLLAEASSSSQEQIDRLQLDVARYAQENVALRKGSGAKGQGQGKVELDQRVQRALDKAQADLESMEGELQGVKEENRRLRAQLEDSRNRGSFSHGDSKELGRESSQLHQENERLKLQLKHFTQLQELATMLQESHKSLVTTNDHLLKELEETKQRHLEEVKQLHWSYNQLRQTMDILPPSSSSHTPRQAPRQTPAQTPRQSTAGHTPIKVVNGYDTSPGGAGGIPGQSPGRKVKGYSYTNGTL